MRSACLLSLLFVLLAALMTSQTVTAVPPPQCSPEYYDELPPRIKKICNALATIAEFSSAMEQYLDDKVLRENSPLVENGVKRQDVDHVFLRFGRRR